MKKDMTKKEIVELIQEKMERAERDWNEYNKLAHSAYGTGVAWGELEMCRGLLAEINPTTP